MWHLILLGLLLTSCGSPVSSSLSSTPFSSRSQLRNELYPDADREKLMALLPTVEPLTTIFRSENTLFYDKRSIVPGYQDSMGDPEGMRPNTLRSNLIDNAVPGGHATLFAQKGRFNFPFGTGGIDHSPNVTSVNFWIPTNEPVVYWRNAWSRWGWVFPVGTQIGEILIFTSPSGSKRVFEIRLRTREVQKWSNRVWRPYQTAKQLADRLAQLEGVPSDLISHLENNDNIVPRELSSAKFAKSWETTRHHVDVLPSFGSEATVDQVYANAPWAEVANQAWKVASDGRIAYGATTDDALAYVPAHYDGASFPVDDDFCARCHKDAGRSIQDFYPVMAAYGELWGEDQTFSWHPFESAMFVGANGDVANFNNDNRRLRKSFKDSGLVVPYNAEQHPNARQLAKSWSYRPF